MPLDKVFDADTRAVLKRCILVEVTAQCVKDSVREKRKFGSDKAISMAESFRALLIRDTGACLLRAQTRQKPDRTHTDRAGRCLPCQACRIPSGQAALPKDAQLGDALQYNPPPAPCCMAPNPLSFGFLAICAICAISHKTTH